MNKTNRYFIEIEGPEYSGKSALAEKLLMSIGGLLSDKNGCDVSMLRTPGSSYLGELLRTAVKTYKMRKETAIGVMLASMGDFLNECVKCGNNVITDRGLLSSIIYQGIMGDCMALGDKDNRELYLHAFKALQRILSEGFNGHYYRVILKVSPETVMARKAIRDKEENLPNTNPDTEDLYDSLDYSGHSVLCGYYNNPALYNLQEDVKVITVDCDNLTAEEVHDVVMVKLFEAINNENR